MQPITVNEFRGRLREVHMTLSDEEFAERVKEQQEVMARYPGLYSQEDRDYLERMLGVANGDGFRRFMEKMHIVGADLMEQMIAVAQREKLLGLRWAMYCRIPRAWGTEDDQNKELGNQQAACIDYSQRYNLRPVGPCWYFEDEVDETTPPSERPGLRELIKSGATGIIVVSRDILGFGRAEIDPWLGSHGLELATVAPTWRMVRV
jgi:hypothetical protein